MGWVLMSERDVRRVEVLTEVLSGRRTVASAAVVLAITARQVNRLLIRFREDGGGGLIHKGRGQSSNHSLSVGVCDYVLELVRTMYADFGPTLATEVLLAKHDIQGSDLADGLAGQYVEVYDFADRPLEVRWKGHSLPYRIFSKDQRVSHTAIVENKRLRHARYREGAAGYQALTGDHH
jgi:hypothetical protein